MAGERLEIDADFDVRDYRDRLKLRGQGADSMTLSNPESLRCPVCDRPFDRLFVTTRTRAAFRTPPTGPFCVARIPTGIVLLAH